MFSPDIKIFHLFCNVTPVKKDHIEWKHCKSCELRYYAYAYKQREIVLGYKKIHVLGLIEKGQLKYGNKSLDSA